MTFGEMVGAVRRFWIVVVVFIAVSVAIAAAAATIPATKYEARATLLAQPDTDRVDFAAVEAVRFLLPSIAELVSTNTFRGDVGRQLQPPAPASEVDVEAEFEPGTGIVHVTATDADPALAQRISQIAAVLLGQQELSTSVDIVVLDPPELPSAPAGPGTVTFLVGGLILGILGGLLAAIGFAAAARAKESALPADALDAHERTESAPDVLGAGAETGAPPSLVAAQAIAGSEAEESPAAVMQAGAVETVEQSAGLRDEIARLGLDVLASIPVKGASSGPAVNGTDHFDHAFKIAARKLVDRAHDHRNVVVTSPRAGAGRTTVAANVAWAVASSGVSVLAVDGDVETPMLHRFLRVGNDRGLSELDASGLRYVVQPSPIPTLAVVAAGSSGVASDVALDNPLRRAFAETAASLVLVDGPAFLGSDTALRACAAAGAVLLVVDASDARSAADLEICVHALGSRGVEILGVLVNREADGVAGRE